MSSGGRAGKGLEKGAMPQGTRPGDVLADRYRLVDLLSESGGGRFWRAHDRVLERHVALHVIAADDERADGLLEAARRSATVLDQRILRVLDAERQGDLCFVVNEWGSGTSLDIMLATNGPQSPRRSSWLVAEVADSIAVAHAAGIAHGRLVPENVMVDTAGSIRIIGFCVDAALHGLPPADPSGDVVDLAGLLYATLTGRWAGTSSSAVPPAPTAGDRVLRPRQVRAGVPRPLDDLCDELLNPKGSRIRDTRDLASARGLHRFLTDFVGDPGGLGEAIAAQNPDKHETLNLPAVPDIVAWPHDAPPPPVDLPATQPRAEEPLPEPTVAVAPVVAPEVQREPHAAQDLAPEAGPAELPTEAGLPIFDDENDEVSWLRARADPVPPPPPFEDPPERPLFAPTPSGGAPVRTPRPVQPTGAGSGQRDEFWPWDGPRSSGTLRAPAEDPVGGEEVPGRSWLRLAALVAVALVLLVAVAIAFNLSRGKTALGTDPEPDPTASQSASITPPPDEPVAITGITATDFDPEGDAPNDENPDEVPNALDGDPATSWSTSTYNQQFGPGGLKNGVGLLLDLGESRSVAEVDLSLEGPQTGVSLYVSDQAPTSVDDLQPIKQVTAGPDEAVTLDEPASGRFLLVWLTSLPPTDDGRFRGVVVDVAVKG
jgi:hypothetical protein